MGCSVHVGDVRVAARGLIGGIIVGHGASDPPVPPDTTPQALCTSYSTPMTYASITYHSLYTGK